MDGQGIEKSPSTSTAACISEPFCRPNRHSFAPGTPWPCRSDPAPPIRIGNVFSGYIQAGSATRFEIQPPITAHSLSAGHATAPRSLPRGSFPLSSVRHKRAYAYTLSIYEDLDGTELLAGPDLGGSFPGNYPLLEFKAGARMSKVHQRLGLSRGGDSGVILELLQKMSAADDGTRERLFRPSNRHTRLAP